MPCCNNSEKGCLEFRKNKSEKRKMCENGKMYMKNKGTYFSLDKWIFVPQFAVLLYRYIKGMFNNYFFS
jgi:hypothetical protein